MEQKNFKISGRQELKEEEVKTVEQVKAMVDYLYHLKGKRIEINERVAKITDELRNNHPDLDQIYLFHIMAHSGANREQCAYFDLPGEDSIVKRLEALVKEYETE